MTPEKVQGRGIGDPVHPGLDLEGGPAEGGGEVCSAGEGLLEQAHHPLKLPEHQGTGEPQAEILVEAQAVLLPAQGAVSVKAPLEPGVKPRPPAPEKKEAHPMEGQPVKGRGLKGHISHHHEPLHGPDGEGPLPPPRDVKDQGIALGLKLKVSPVKIDRPHHLSRSKRTPGP